MRQINIKDRQPLRVVMSSKRKWGEMSKLPKWSLNLTFYDQEVWLELVNLRNKIQQERRVVEVRWEEVIKVLLERAK